MQISLGQYLKTVEFPVISICESGIGRDVPFYGKADKELLSLIGTVEDESWTWDWDGPKSWPSSEPAPEGISHVAVYSDEEQWVKSRKKSRAA